jgi:hypothetical protein
MLSKLTRVAVLFILALMIAAWALSAGKGNVRDPQNDQPVDRMYS